MPLVAWIFSLAGPLVANVLIGLGIGSVTYVGMDLLLTSLIDMIKINVANVPLELSLFLDMVGFFDAVGLLLGAISAKLALASLTKFRLANP